MPDILDKKNSYSQALALACSALVLILNHAIPTLSDLPKMNFKDCCKGRKCWKPEHVFSFV